MAGYDDRRLSPNGALYSINTRATHAPSSDFLNVSLDFNAAPNGTARGTEVVIPDNASPQVRAAAEAYNNAVVEFARANGIPDYPNRGVKTRSENQRGVANTVHTEPFFNTDLDMQRAIQQNPQAFSQIYQNTFGGIGNARIIAAHGVGNDRGAASDIFGNETDFGRTIIGAALSGEGGSIPALPAPPIPTLGAGDTALVGQQAADTIQPFTVTPQQAASVYQAYINGQMSPEQAAEYQADVAAGRMMIPEGVTLEPTQQQAVPQAAPIAADPDVVANVYRAYASGQMDIVQAQEYAADVAAGRMPLPDGVAQLSGDPMTPSADADTRTTAQATGAADPRFTPDLTRQFAAESGGDLARQAAAGLTGSGPSITGQAFPNAPGIVQGAGDAGLAVLGGLGAVGGAAAGAVGDVAEAAGVPRAPQLARDLAALPEALAGSPAQAVRGTAARGVTPKITAARETEQRARGVIDDAAATGINVLTSDVRPPNTFASRWLQGIGEKIPVAGTGGQREAQVAQRQAAITDTVRAYVPEGATPDAILRNVTEDLIATRGARIAEQSAVKNEVIDRLSNGTPVDMARTVAQIDSEVARLRGLNTSQVEPVISVLEDWRTAIQGQDLRNVEELRKQVGQVFEGENMAGVRDIGEKALRSVYGPLNEDMGDFIKANGATPDYNQWRVSNRRLSEIASELNGGALRNVLRQGEEKPEVVRGMLFGSNTSDIEKLYRNLSTEGQQNARAAVMLEAFERAGGEEALSPTRFANNVNRLGRQVGVVFSEDDQAVVKGLMNVLQATKRADQAAASPPTGVQNTMFLGGAALTDLLGGFGAATASAGGIGGLARVYESKPVRNMLIKISGTRGGSPEQARLIDNLGQIVTTGAIAASQAPQGETTGQQQ